MNRRLEDRTLIVTGAASGIGRGTALRMLHEGARVAALDMSEEGLSDLMGSVPSEDRNRLFTQLVDISEEDSVKAGIAAVIGRWSRLDALVNAAGILYGDHTHQMTLDRWNRMIDVNLTGTFLMVREALPALLATGKGVIINFSSTSAFFAHPYMAAYSATKGAIAAFTHSVALEYASAGLRAVNIVPGGIESGMTSTTVQSLPADTDWSLFTNLQARLNSGAQGAPENVAGVIAMLISEDGSFLTGTEIRIDGGAHM